MWYEGSTEVTNSLSNIPVELYINKKKMKFMKYFERNPPMSTLKRYKIKCQHALKDS
jgi:hypothetical protein